jgi:glycosyltransferase involved in cell wall biosynthesis
MRILIDLQPLQTRGVANRGVGKYTNGFLQALASSHEVVGIRRDIPYIVPPSANIPTITIPSGRPESLEEVISDDHFDVVVNCSGPNWEENVIVSPLRTLNRPITASILYDLIPWVFPHVYLQDPQLRQKYHNRCVELYAQADLVCAISQNSTSDALRFGYATHESAATISLGVEHCLSEVQSAHEKWNISQPYLLNVSGDEFRKNPEMLISGYVASDLSRSHSLVLVISNDAETGFSSRIKARFGNLKDRVFILPEVTDVELGALYRDCDAFVFTSLYEGFGIPAVEAMQFGKWVISSKASSLDEVNGPALLALIQDPSKPDSIAMALNEAKQRLDHKSLDESIPRAHSQKFTWKQVLYNFEDAVDRRRKALSLELNQPSDRPRLFWASPFPGDQSGVAFYSEDLMIPLSRNYDIVLVPNTPGTFIPTAKTGRFKVAEPRLDELLAVTNGQQPRVVYDVGNSHFHLNLLELLFKVPGTVLLHDSFIQGLETLWRQRKPSETSPLDVQIIESSRQMVFLADHARSLIAPEHLAKRPSYVVPHYCRCRGMIPAARKIELRRKYGIPQNAFVVTTTGFQDRIKLTDRFVEACVELKNFENAPVYVQILGHFFNGELEAEIRGMLVEYNMQAFLPGTFLDEERLIDRLALTDVAVFLRERSTGAASGTLSDALGAGIPCVVTDDFAFREYPESTVLRVSNNECIEGLILLYRHAAIRQALSAGALRYAEQMSLERIAAKLCETLSLYGNEQEYSTRYRTGKGESLLSAMGHRRPAEAIEPAEAGGATSTSMGTSELEISPIIDNIRNRILEELDTYVANYQMNSCSTPEIESSRAGLRNDSNLYQVNELRQIPEPELFETLSILLFKKRLDETPLLRVIEKFSRRRLAILLMCTLLPGRRARIAGLYRQILRSAHGKVRFLCHFGKDYTNASPERHV